MLRLAHTIIKTTDSGLAFGNKKNKRTLGGMSAGGILLIAFMFIYFGGFLLFFLTSSMTG